MINLYVLIMMAVIVLGNQDLEELCPDKICVPKDPSKYSDKPAPNIKMIFWYQLSDLDVVKVTPNLKHLSVDNCNSDFKMNAFPPLETLKSIYITNCSISELQNYQFENVINLDSLHLNKNNIEILSNEAFHKLSNLIFLDLENNLIRVLPEGIFDPLENIISINLRNNNISILPKDTFLRNSRLTSINLSGNPLKIVSLDFLTYAYVAELDLSNCVELRDLRLSIKVYTLSLKNSGVESLNITGSIHEIGHKNSKVTGAVLSGTDFGGSFVPVLCDMPSLEWLDLSNSSIKFSYSYRDREEKGKECKFPNIRSLNLSGNKLNNIPRRLPPFGPNLTTLDLSDNLLEDGSLDDLFFIDAPNKEEGNFSSLSFLHLARNKLKNVPRRCPLFGPNLNVLDLSHNLLENISLESLAKAHNLQSLLLDGNRLTSFDYLSVCDGLKNLKQLVLYDNAFDATFYGNMTEYLGEKGLKLNKIENRIFVEAENQVKNNA